MGAYSIFRINILYFPWSHGKKKKWYLIFQGEPGEKGGIGSIGPRVWMFRISLLSCVFVSTLTVPHHLFLLSMWMNCCMISSVSENRDGAYLNKWLQRYWILTGEISQVQFSSPHDHPVTLFSARGKQGIGVIKWGFLCTSLLHKLMAFWGLTVPAVRLRTG